MVFGGMGAAKSSSTVKNITASSRTGLDIPENTPGVQFNHHSIPPKGAGWSWRGASEDSVPQSPDLVEKVKNMVKEANEGTVVVEEDEMQERNPKKRMMELEKEHARLRDEL